MPLVRYVGGTWRVGGILALSRAFGDAYMKGSLQFEGVRASSDGYSSGFGVIAEPYTTLTDLQRAGQSCMACPRDSCHPNWMQESVSLHWLALPSRVLCCSSSSINVLA